MTEIITYQTQELQTMAKAMAKLFAKTPEDLFALMLIAQAENKHPAIAAQEYDIIQGRPALKSQATLARFQASQGKIQWLERNDAKASAKFTHPAGGELTVTWTIERATKAGLTGKDNWKKFPAQMLSSRVVAEGVRAVYPACLSGFYVTEEVQDIDDSPRQAAPVAPEPKQEAVEVQATVVDEPAPKKAKPAPKKAKPEAKPKAEAEPKPANQASPEYLEARTAMLKKVAEIVGAKDSPDAWSDAEKDSIETKALVAQSKETQDIGPLETLLARAKIMAVARQTGEWNIVLPLVLAADSMEKLAEIERQLVESQQQPGIF